LRYSKGVVIWIVDIFIDTAVISMKILCPLGLSCSSGLYTQIGVAQDEYNF